MIEEEIRIFCYDYDGQCDKVNAALYQWNKSKNAYVSVMCYQPWTTIAIATIKYAFKGVTCYKTKYRLDNLPEEITLEDLKKFKKL